MKILEAIFDGYIRIATTGYEYFKFTPTQPLQVFLGTNGSGKSSLIVEMFPFPPNRHDFKPGGSKTVRYLHRDKEYLVTYKITEGRKEGELQMSCSFQSKETWGWWEQNPNSKVPMQMELIQKYFNITPELRDYLIGDKCFTDLGPTERRVILTKLSDADYTFGLSLFDLAKRKLRDTSGAINFIKERIATESTKLISKEEARELEELQETLHVELNRLYRERNNQLQPSKHYQDLVEGHWRRIETLTQGALTASLTRPEGVAANSLEDLQTHIQDLKQEAYAQERLINALTSQHESLVRDRDQLQALGTEGLEGVHQRIHAAGTRIADLRAQLGHPWDFPNVLLAYDTFKGVEASLTQTLADLPDNSDGYYSSAVLTKLRAERETVNTQLQTVKQTYLQTQARLRHQYEHRGSKETVCPNCQHHWVLGFNQAVMESLETEVEALTTEQTALETRLNTLDANVSDILAFMDRYRGYVQIRQHAPSLQPLWDLLDHKNLAFVSPKEALSIVHRLRRDFELLMEVHETEAAKLRDVQLAESLKLTDLERLKTAASHVDQLATQIAQDTEKLQGLQNQLRELQTYHNDLQRLVRTGSELERVMYTAQQVHQEWLKALHNEYVNEAIRLIQRQLGITESKFNLAQNQVGLIEDLNNQLYQLEVQYDAYKEIVRQLSPTEGLIAEGLFGFIKAYVKQMNHFISSMWSYPMEVLPSKFKDDSSELAYYFPVVLPNRDHPLDDIRLCSKGMRAVINLAFKVILIKYLHLMDIPLVLDEFGDGLDDRHRSSSAVVIQRIIEQMHFEQVFFVSHYVESYGALANAEICLLDASNVQVSLKHNEHVVMK